MFMFRIKKQPIYNKDSVDRFFEWLKRYVDNILPSIDEAKKLFLSGKKLSFYLGIDPTGPDIHLGHSTNFFVLKKLIELGHEVTLLIGDFTAQIGDPSGKTKARKALSRSEVEVNMKTYLQQATKILPKGKFAIRYNSEWHRNMIFQQVLELASYFTVQQMIARDMFQERLQKDEPIHLQEFLYPLIQGYDSVVMKVDGEVGGTDQLFNMLAGRTLEKKILGKEKLVITTKLLEDPITNKKIMNKSEGGYISMNNSAKDMYGKIMAMPDSSIVALYKYTTEAPLESVSQAEERIKTENPKIVKKEVAKELVRMYHGEKEADKAHSEFEKVFSKGELPEDIKEWSLKTGETNIVDVLAGSITASSKTDAKRLIDQKAVEINGQTIIDWRQEVKSGDIIKVGPRKFLKIS